MGILAYQKDLVTVARQRWLQPHFPHMRPLGLHLQSGSVFTGVLLLAGLINRFHYRRSAKVIENYDAFRGIDGFESSHEKQWTSGGDVKP